MANEYRLTAEHEDFNRTEVDRQEWGTVTTNNIKKGSLIIRETITEKEGKTVKVYILFEDTTDPEGFYTYTKRGTGEEVKDEHRDEVRYDWEAAGMMLRKSEYESVGWSTGWQDSLAGKQRELEHRTAALAYFTKRKAELVK